jgi:hypothetical protein
MQAPAMTLMVAAYQLSFPDALPSTAHLRIEHCCRNECTRDFKLTPDTCVI